MELLTSAEAWIALATLTALELVLGIDNIIFISILAGRLPVELQQRARRVGLLLAMFMRIALLLAIGWVMGLTQGLFGLDAFWTGVAGDRFELYSQVGAGNIVGHSQPVHKGHGKGNVDRALRMFFGHQVVRLLVDRG